MESKTHNISISVKPEYEFRWEESVKEWEQTIEDLCISMELATDKRGLKILSTTSPILQEFMKASQLIKDNMNRDGGGCTLIPGSGDYD